MKIALIVPGGVDRSGTRKVIPCLLWLIERLATGDEVHVFALQQEAKPASWELLGARVHNAGSPPTRLRAVGQLLAEHRRAPFDVAHAWWAGGPGTVAAMFKALTGVPTVLTLPGGDLVAIRDIGYGGQLSWRSRASIRLALKAADRIVVPSDWMRAQAADYGFDSITIPLGVALDRWPRAKPRRREPGAPLRLLHVANLNSVKDQTTLLTSMRLIREQGLEFQLDVVGFDTLDGAIQRRTIDLGLERQVTYHGFLPQGQMRPLVERAHMMVVSSRHEGVPIAALEAAVAGIPTVGTAVGIIADWAPDAAVAVPVAKPEVLGEAIVALAGDEDRRLLLAERAQALAVAQDADVTAERTRGLYRTLCDPRQRRVG